MNLLPTLGLSAMFVPTLFAQAEDLQAGAVQNQIHRLQRLFCPGLNRQGLASTAQYSRTGHGKTQTKQVKDTLGKALGLVLSKMVDCTQR